MIAWLGKDWITLRFVRAIDYLYLSAAAVGLAISALRQSIEHSQYAALWFPTVIWWLIAALALRLTRTTIEVFHWYRG